jgi:hypothetical protein
MNRGNNAKENSPRFLQINLKMFNNYMTSGNPPAASQFVPSSGNKFGGE